MPLKPEEVFTPKTIVTRQMFEKRNESDIEGRPGLQDSLVDALRETGGQVLLYGDTGVGKSSLLKYAAEDEKKGFVSISCKSSDDHAGILDALVRKLVDVEKISISKSKNVGGEASVEGHVPWFAKVTGKVTTSGGQTSDFRVIEKSALDVIVAAMVKSGRSLIVLDNFQNIKEPNTRVLIAQTMEELSDLAGASEGAPDIKCVVIGIAEDAGRLLGESRSYLRRTTEIGVPRMPDDEIRAILARGFRSLLKIDIDEAILDDFVFYSDGFPYFAHLLGLHVARSVVKAEQKSVSATMLEPALERAAMAVSSTYEGRIRTAYEAGGDVQPRKQILRLLANSAQRSWSSADVQALWDEHVGIRDQYAFMHTALGQLAGDKGGNVLVRSGSRKKYRYRFEDPHMRPYLRIVEGATLRSH